ncbi:hypothetical protein GCM10025857_16380 [Alicyclobacillus contaminans]|uniref:sensor histidine kinase n=1 Tax=Alicyclobacillus contaminans TaxID=392016 RepID=UPI0004230E7A|nr:sensor histidine kinase [Alicyclobacillus contaminans]GMA50281.1 hypothetical protein GCM10025857_16380 [Alicyclobacillus contaminans]
MGEKENEKARFIDMLEQERRRLAREIHDVPAQWLTTTAMRLEVVQRLLAAGRADEAAREVGRLRVGLKMAIADVRRLIFDLRPSLLKYGIQAAIHMYAERFAEAFGLSVDVRGEWPTHTLGEAEDVAVFRVFQELLNNVYKHAHARCVTVTLYAAGDVCGLSIADDGHGFPAEAPASSEREDGHYGWLGMQERMALVGGRLWRVPNVRQGACVVCEIPLRQKH